MTRSYACGTGDLPLTAETIGLNLQRTATLHGEHDAVVSVNQGIRWSYREFDDRVDALADGLLGAGIRKGEQVMAWVILKPGTSVTEADLRAYCTDRIARFKIPHYFKFVDAFPITVTGKIQKYRMRELAIQELLLQSAARVATA